MTYTLANDREIEYGYMRERLPPGEGTVFDFGPSPAGTTVQYAIAQGYRVHGLGLEPQSFQHPDYAFTYGDILTAPLKGIAYDWIMNVSTVEHVGLAGRYGTHEDIPDGDLLAMMRLRELMGPRSRQILVVPVGFDCIASPWHRVYGNNRLPQLLRGYRVLDERYWVKRNNDDEAWVEAGKQEALDTMPIIGPPNYYALGGLLLERADLPTRHYCTLFDENYLDRGLALHESMERWCQPYHLWILALSETCREVLALLDLPHVSVVPLEELETKELLGAKESRTWQEYIWTLTGPWMLEVFKRGRMESLAYMDADCFFYADPEPVYQELSAASLGITPHRASPYHRKSIVTNGYFNVGMVFARNDETALTCLTEWSAQCVEWCYLRHGSPGRYCDQKYLDAWPGKYGAWPIWHKGANLAPWNQGEGQYRYACRGGRIYIDGEPLLWFHFHKRLLPMAPGDHRLDPFVARYVYPPYADALERAALRAAEAEHAVDHRDDLPG